MIYFYGHYACPLVTRKPCVHVLSPRRRASSSAHPNVRQPRRRLRHVVIGCQKLRLLTVPERMEASIIMECTDRIENTTKCTRK